MIAPRIAERASPHDNQAPLRHKERRQHVYAIQRERPHR
jgi:hypothetical protein